MKKITVFVFFIAVYSVCFSQQDVLIDAGWKFHRGDLANAQATDFSDKGWRDIDLPHDWGIEDLPGTHSPFNPDVVNGVSIGFTTGGTGWYRKTFKIPLSAKNKSVSIQFDGVYMNADIWLNGKHLGNHPYGYTSFYYDITNDIIWDKENVLAVQVKNEGSTSRWYAGSGINRHVWIKIAEPVHVAQWGVFITTPEVSASKATVNFKTTVQNQGNSKSAITLASKVINARGKQVAQTKTVHEVGAGGSYEFNENAGISSPVLWSVQQPGLYKLVSEVYVNGKLVDKRSAPFGIRKISFDAINGFMLNNEPMKLKGACFHIDNGPLGTKSLDAAEIRRVALLKASGFNAIRCSHNPPPEAFLNACDSLGVLVIDEAFDMWNRPKNEQDYFLYFKDWWQRDLQSMLLRDRNHPSIIMWSIGNEIVGMDDASVADTAKLLADYVRSMDNTRPVTAAVNGVTDQKDPFFAALDVCGYNYARDKYESDHERKPGRIMFATESYALTQFDYWMSVVDHPWVIGDFIWTGFDYIGEASIGWRGYPQETNFYPWNLAYCGDIDICGWKRPQSFYRDALWKANQLSVFVKPPKPSFPVNPKTESWSIWNWDDVVADWNWKGYEDSTLEVNVYSSCDEVELFVNGKSLGKKATGRSTKFMAVYKVAYVAGTLKAVGYANGKKINESVLQTSGDPGRIKLSANRNSIKADGEDLSYVNVELVDAKGIKNPKSTNLVNFEIEGGGTIVGVGNADPTSLESYQQPQRKAWQGRCLVVVKSNGKPGKIILKAQSAGIAPAQVVISSK